MVSLGSGQRSLPSQCQLAGISGLVAGLMTLAIPHPAAARQIIDRSAINSPAIEQSSVVAQATASAALLAQVERFFDLLFVQAGYAEASEMIAPVLRSEFSPEVLQRKRQEFETGSGKFVKILEGQVVEDIVIVEVEFERRMVTFVISFDNNQQIAGVNPVLDFIGTTAP